MRKALLVTASILGLSGCVSDYDQCVNRASADVRNIQSGITLISANLARGYAIHVSQEAYTHHEICFDKDNKAYDCSETLFRDVETPVAIDASLEKSKLAALKARLAPAQRRMRSEVQACEGLDGS